MSDLFNSIFGDMDPYQHNSFRGYNSVAQQNIANAQQQYHFHKAGQAAQQVKWMYNGHACTVKEFADIMYVDDEQGKLMFLLKHGGV